MVVTAKNVPLCYFLPYLVSSSSLRYGDVVKVLVICENSSLNVLTRKRMKTWGVHHQIQFFKLLFLILNMFSTTFHGILCRKCKSIIKKNPIKDKQN